VFEKEEQTMKLIVMTIIGSLMILFSANYALSDIVTAEPDDFSEGTVLDSVFPGITLERFFPPYIWPVSADDIGYASTGTLTFGEYYGEDFNIYFHTPTNYFSIDLIGWYWDTSNSDWGGAFLDYYDANNSRLGQQHFTWYSLGDIYNVTINDPTYSISKVTIWGDIDSSVGADNLQYNLVPEPVSMILFVVGAGLLLGRKYLKRK